MTTYREDRYEINGADTAVFTAGEGPPLVFLHGAGTATGFDSLLPLAERATLVVSHHPGFGASGDSPTMDSIQDLVLHHLDLLDRLELDRISLVGHSMGGQVATIVAMHQPDRVERLVLAAPFGLDVPEYPTVDFFSIPPEEVPAYLTADLSVFAGVPDPPPPEFLAARAREAESYARIKSKGTFDPRLRRWLHRVTMPTLVVWGDADRLIPVGQAAAWAGAIPDATTRILPGVGHLLFDESRDAVDAVGDFVAAG